MRERNLAPRINNKLYINTKYAGYNKCIVIDSVNGSVLPNCVGYAYGRTLEIANRIYMDLPTCNAEDWWNRWKYDKGSSPREGAVMCWRKGKVGNGSDGAGHVAVVEHVNDDGSVIVSASNYGGKRWYRHLYTPPYNSGNLIFIGFLYNPYVEVSETKKELKSIEMVARDVINGKYGNGEARKKRLIEEGYNYNDVQNKVNELLSGSYRLTSVAIDVIAGKYGNGSYRRQKLRQAGYDYKAVQAEVNRLLNK